MEVHYVVTVLNKHGRSASRLLIQYDRNSEVSGIKGNVYNRRGELIKKIKKSDIKDNAYNSDYTLFSDHRVKHYQGISSDYPYTVEFQYKVNYHGIVGFPIWFPQKFYNVSTEYAELILRTPAEYDIRFKELNNDFIFNTREADNVKHYTWICNNLRVLVFEAYSPDYLSIVPAVYLSPNNISYENTEGEFTSWESYGEWSYDLISDRDGLSSETCSKIKRMVDTIPDSREKIKTIYEYMQGRTRYVNISLGIGGFQPFPAEIVDEKGYGDCKALSNYTRALLKCASIHSYYCEIGSGISRRIKFPDFPSINQTNHVILCVPDKNDTIWLECTNQYFPFNYIGRNNSDRYALLITENGGFLARTPTYDARDNLRKSDVYVNVSRDGSANIRAVTEFHALLYDDVFYMINKTNKEQKDLLTELLVANGLRIIGFSIEDQYEGKEKALINLDGSIDRYAVKSGSRLFLEPLFIFDDAFPSHIDTDRKNDFYQAMSYAYNDSLVLNIPDDYSLEHLPENITLTSELGYFSINYDLTDKELIVTRKVQINKGKYGSTHWKDINIFLTTISSKQEEKIILNNSLNR